MKLPERSHRSTLVCWVLHIHVCRQLRLRLQQKHRSTFEKPCYHDTRRINYFSNRPAVDLHVNANPQGSICQFCNISILNQNSVEWSVALQSVWVEECMFLHLICTGDLGGLQKLSQPPAKLSELRFRLEGILDSP